MTIPRVAGRKIIIKTRQIILTNRIFDAWNVLPLELIADKFQIQFISDNLIRVKKSHKQRCFCHYDSANRLP